MKATKATSNERTLDEGFKKGLKLINEYIVSSLTDICAKILREVVYNREFQGWSGNTQQSYMGCVYFNGIPVALVHQKNWSRPAIRTKLKKGEWGHLKRPYEGEERSVQGKVDTDGGYGIDTSIKFLKEYSKCPSQGFAMVVTTGTEYSEYLEDVANLDVLTKTFDEAKMIIMKGFKPMKE